MAVLVLQEVAVTIAERVNRGILDAMKARDKVRLDALRMLKAALTSREIERRRELDEAEAQQVVLTLVKQRRESIEQFRKAGREDLVRKETSELAELEGLLPPPVDDEELEQVLGAAIAHTGATSLKDLGRVMKEALARLSGRPVDARRLNARVKQRLGG
jgi:uncharacterized protein